MRKPDDLLDLCRTGTHRRSAPARTKGWKRFPVRTWGAANRVHAYAAGRWAGRSPRRVIFAGFASCQRASGVSRPAGYPCKLKALGLAQEADDSTRPGKSTIDGIYAAQKARPV